MTHGDLIMVEWIDPQSDSAWVAKHEESLSPTACTSVGFFNCWKDGNLLIFASYHGEDIGDRTSIPKTLVKKIKTLKPVRKTGRK